MRSYGVAPDSDPVFSIIKNGMAANRVGKFSRI